MQQQNMGERTPQGTPRHAGPKPLNTPEELRAIRQAMDEGKNPLLATGVPRWEDQVGVSRIINRRVLELEPLPTPAQVLAELPLDSAAQEIVAYSRDEIRACLYGQDDRLLVIVGPCSVHDPNAALDYAHRLSKVMKETEGELLIVMRVYFEKPRTTVGWKGLINDPDIDGSHNIRKGLLLARKTLIGVLGEGLAAATEFLEPTSPQFISDAVSWGAIGARNTESQVHRQLASGMSMPIGFKNATDGSVKAAVNRLLRLRAAAHVLRHRPHGPGLRGGDARQPGLPRGAARLDPRAELRHRIRAPCDGRRARDDAGGICRHPRAHH